MGNTTAAVTKGYAIAWRVLAALVLFADFQHKLELGGRKVSFDLTDPAGIIGLFIGGMIPFLLESDGDAACWPGCWQRGGRGASPVPGNCRDHGTTASDYSRAVDLLTKSRLIKEMIIPSLLPVLTPIVVAFGMHARRYQAKTPARRCWVVC